MAAYSPTQAWRRGLVPAGFVVLVVAVCLAMIRARQQPSVDLSLGGTTVSVTTLDLALALVAVLALRELARTRELDRWLTAAATGFAAWILVTAALNGATAFVSGAKLVLLGALALGTAVYLTRPGRVHALLLALVAMTLAADTYGLINYVVHGGGRQQAFLGEHDFAALATVPLLYGLVTLFSPDPRLPSLRWPAIVLGGLGISLAATLASLLALYIAVVVLGVIAWRRAAFTRRAAATTLAVVVAVSIPTFWLRSNDISFLHAWFGKPAPENPDQFAASWSQRLIFAYIDGRVFLDHPVAGTGWWGNLPSEEYAQYLPDARRQFTDQPAHYFPPADGSFIPQQTLDQVLAELGLVGAALLLAILAGCVRNSARTARAWPRGDPDDWFAYVPAVVTASTVGVLAGEALFGGTPTTGIFWLTIGLAAARVRPEAT